jgi:putative sterol carrier protein
MNAADVFKGMPARFSAEKAGDMNASVVFQLSGDGGGSWTVNVANGTCQVEEGASDSPNATIMMDAGDYVDMTSGKLNPMAAFMSGKVKVDGDLNTVMKFQSLFGM